MTGSYSDSQMFQVCHVFGLRILILLQKYLVLIQRFCSACVRALNSALLHTCINLGAAEQKSSRLTVQIAK